MRPLTEALLRGNSENLTRKGWKPDEQRRCFKKADALLDYIGRIKPADYIQESWYKKLNEQRLEGLKYCLKQNMPSAVMQQRSLSVLSTLLSIGQEMLQRSAWIYKNYPALFKAKYASSQQAFEKDAHFYFIKGHTVPENSFLPFKTGENPAVNRGESFLNKAVEMYMDPIFETSEYADYKELPVGKRYPFNQWIQKQKAGKRFWSEYRSLTYAINQLSLEKAVEAQLEKSLSIIKKQRKMK